MKKCACRVAWTMIVLALTASQSLAQSTYEPYTFTTLAGLAGSPFVDYGVHGPLEGRKVSVDGSGSAARFWHPSSVAVDNAGNLYVADNGTIRKVTPAGVVTTLAGLAGVFGNADGTGTAARFSSHSGVAVDSDGNVYVADSWNNTIRKVTPTGVVTTLAGLTQVDGNGNPIVGSADGMGSAARFANPFGVAVDSDGNVYVADSYYNTIRKVTPAGAVTTLAGLAQCCDASGNPVSGSADGTGSAARFSDPRDVAVDIFGNVYVADSCNRTIRKVTPAGVVTTLAGRAERVQFDSCIACSADGSGSDARFIYPTSVATDSAGNVYVADSGSQTIRKVTPAGVVTTLAGLAGSPGRADGPGNTARFGGGIPVQFITGPSGVAADSVGNVYVADTWNNTIRKVTPAGVVTTLAGLPAGPGRADGTGADAQFRFPSAVAVDSTGNVYVVDTGNGTIRKVTPAGVVTTLAGRAGSYGNEDGTGSEAQFDDPNGVAVDSVGNVYVADSGSYTIRKVTPAGVVTTVAGLVRGSADGAGRDAQFFYPTGVSLDSAGNVYVADYHTIRKVTPTGEVTTLAGMSHDTNGDGFPDGEYSDGTGSDARFNRPSGVAVDETGNVYVADTSNSTIRKVTPSRVVTTLAGLAGSFGHVDGTGNAARFANPSGVAVDSAGNVYVADIATIRKVTPGGEVTTLAGLEYDDEGRSFGADGTGSAARFWYASGVAVDSTGNAYVADTYNHTIRKGYAAPRILNSGSGFGFNSGQFGFNLTGPSGRLVVVEGSTDLVNWLPLWTNTFTFPAALNFSDPQSGASSTRFYRARRP